jgi:hypothetical protein
LAIVVFYGHLECLLYNGQVSLRVTETDASEELVDVRIWGGSRIIGAC